MDEPVDDRLTTLEERYTAAERALHELSDVVWDQARTIQRLEARLTQLEDRLRAVEEGGGSVPVERPPHY
jgi:uncharacterized coiled-coil protein SlyX